MSGRELRTRLDSSPRELVLARIREGQRFVLATHEKPDGDALGSMVGDAGAPGRTRQGLR